MKKLRKMLENFYSRHALSIRVPLVIIMMLLCMIPLLIQGQILASSSKQIQIDRHIIDVQNQCQIMSNKMSRNGYLSSAAVNNAGIDAELSLLADIFNGRILIVNSGFKIVKDTFSLSEGKVIISEETIRCFKGESTKKYDTEKHYVLLAIPITEHAQSVEPGATAKTAGVMLVTVSTESLTSLESALQDKTSRYVMIVFVICALLSVAAVQAAFRPFDRLVSLINRLAEGNLDEDVKVNTYSETRRMSESLNQMLATIRAVEQSRQEFVSNVSHELKTPITSIRVLADSLMGMDQVPEELYKEFMSDISDEIDRESKIIDDLLTLVRMDKESPEMSFAPANVNSLIEMVLKRLRPIARKRNIELIFESMREVVADIDEVKLSLAINNLVENGIKYNKEDGWVRVTLDADHKFFYLRVADSGVGIPEEFKDRVFERFYRVDKARSRETGGTGLGLAITKNVILLHHGAVRVESEEGEGTVFLVRIPLKYIT